MDKCNHEPFITEENSVGVDFLSRQIRPFDIETEGVPALLVCKKCKCIYAADYVFNFYEKEVEKKDE